MHRKNRLLIAIAVLISGCALQDTRYDNSGVAAGFGPDYNQSIIDWNFPTSTNQGPLLPPERFRPVRPAIGVPWATSDPAPWRYGDRSSPAGPTSGSAAHDSTPCAVDCPPVVTNDAASARAGSTRCRAKPVQHPPHGLRV